MAWVSHAKYLAFLKTPKWRAQRERAFRHHGRRCLACGARRHLQIHHASYRDPLGEERMVFLLPLCKRCHEGVTRYIEQHKGEATFYALTWRYIFGVRRLYTGDPLTVGHQGV